MMCLSRVRTVGTVLLAALTCSASAGCGRTEEADLQPDASSDRTITCPGRQGWPITADDALDHFRQHGYALESVRFGLHCDISTTVALLTNSPGFAGLSENAASKGHLICHIETSPILDKPSVTVRRLEGKTILYAQNVKCTLYPRTDVAAQTSEIERAFEAFD